MASLPTPSTRNASRPLPPDIIVQRCTCEDHLSGLRRLNTVLLPIPYPDAFYRDVLSDPAVAELTRVAVVREKRKRRRVADKNEDEGDDDDSTPGKIVGGIRCRYEDVPVPASSYLSGSAATTRPMTPRLSTFSGAHAPSLADRAKQQHQQKMANGKRRKIYVQTLAVQAPYRSLGIATHLLDEIVLWVTTGSVRDDEQDEGHGEEHRGNSLTASSSSSTGRRDTSKTAVVDGQSDVTEIYAHVWEKNEDALEWYRGRGFEIGDRIEGYYRRLRPSGAVLVRRILVD